MKTKIAIEAGVAAFAVLAGIFWTISARVDVPVLDQALLGLDKNPAEAFNAALKAAAEWNKYAAYSAAVAAFLQAIAFVVSRTKT